MNKLLWAQVFSLVNLIIILFLMFLLGVKCVILLKMCHQKCLNLNADKQLLWCHLKALEIQLEKKYCAFTCAKGFTKGMPLLNAEAPSTWILPEMVYKLYNRANIGSRWLRKIMSVPFELTRERLQSFLDTQSNLCFYHNPYFNW